MHNKQRTRYTLYILPRWIRSGIHSTTFISWKIRSKESRTFVKHAYLQFHVSERIQMKYMTACPSDSIHAKTFEANSKEAVCLCNGKMKQQ